MNPSEDFPRLYALDSVIIKFQHIDDSQNQGYQQGNAYLYVVSIIRHMITSSFMPQSRPMVPSAGIVIGIPAISISLSK